VPESTLTRTRIKLSLLLAVFCAPLVASYLAYFIWPPRTSMNYGELLRAAPLVDSELRTPEGKGFRLSALRGKWVLLHVDSGDCRASCLQKLGSMRQVRAALGKDRDRVERVFLIDDSTTPESAVVTEFAGTLLARAAAGALLSQLAPRAEDARRYVYLVDPLGNLVLRYPDNPDNAKMLKDLQRLLRASRIG
jgi:cytochrome oxidase Cu insertion factor (SCO1/SenC/PrrC family)